MDEYIERERLLNSICNKHCDCNYDGGECPNCRLTEPIVAAQAADVAPVRHGRWVSLRKGDWTSVYECSECKRKETVGCDRSKADEQVKRLYPYCHCGAKMDGAE